MAKRAVRSNCLGQVGLGPGAAWRVPTDENGGQRRCRSGRALTARRHTAEVRRVELIVEVVVGVAQRVGDREVRAEIVLDPDGADVDVGDRVVGRQAVEIMPIDRGRRATHERDARVRHIVFGQMEITQDHGRRCAKTEAEFGRHAPMPVLDVVAIGHPRGFAHRIQSKSGRRVDRLIDIDRAPVLVVRADVGGQHIPGRQSRRLAHLIDRAPRRSPTEQGGRRPLQDFDRLQVERIADVDRRIADAVEEEVVEGGEAADVDGVAPRRALSGIERHAGNVLQGVLEAGDRLLLQQALRNDIDRLRCVLHRQRDLVPQQGTDTANHDLIHAGGLGGLLVIGRGVARPRGLSGGGLRAHARGADTDGPRGLKRDA